MHGGSGRTVHGRRGGGGEGEDIGRVGRGGCAVVHSRHAGQRRDGRVGGLGAKGALAGAAMGAAGSIGGGGVGTAAASARMLPGMPGVPKMPAGAKVTATAQGLAGMQTAVAQMNAASAATGGTGEISTEAAGEQMKLSGAVPDEIKKGKLTIKKIDWVHDNAAVSPSTTQGFMDLMMSAGQAMKAAGATYRVDVYMDKKYAGCGERNARRAARALHRVAAAGRRTAR